jgi:hypothetical protein
MNVQRIQSLVAGKAGRTASPDPVRLSRFERLLAQRDIRDYLLHCLPAESYTASGVGVADLERLEAENLEHATPGLYLFPRGYLVIATSVGGNAVCVHESGRVYWFDHSSFYDDRVSYKDRATNQWVYETLGDESMARAGVLLSPDLEPFLEQLLTDQLEERLDELD